MTAVATTEYLRVRGARVHNLRDISVDIPKRQLTVVTGVSGSGKSSLVFDTIAAESQRQLGETFSTFVRNRLPKYGRPDVDRLTNLSTAIVVDQKRITGNARSTVGTITDIAALLRLLWSRAGEPYLGASNLFSFNDPEGMCPRCSGLGEVRTVDLDRLVDRTRSLNEGAIVFPTFGVGGWMWRTFADSGLFDNDKPLERYTEQEWAAFVYGADATVRLPSQGGPVPTKYEGLLQRFERIWLPKDPESLSGKTRAAFESVVRLGVCEQCRGARLSPAALSSTIAGMNLAECYRLEAVELARFLRGIESPVAAPILAEAIEQVDRLVGIGLGYLSMDRATGTLSGGESQRVKMVRQLGSSLTDMTCIFDEPSIGLHPHDIQAAGELLCSLRDKGNTVIVVEHDPAIIRIADHVVDIGPGHGSAGGQVVYQGPVSGLAASPGPTGKHLERVPEINDSPRKPDGWVAIRGADKHNLRGIDVDIPLGVLTAVTGVAGSGKSTLLREYLPGANFAGQLGVHRSRRSNMASYTGMLDRIRTIFAAEHGVPAALFSANSKGACANCSGLGVVYTDLAFLDPVTNTCEQCGGRRFAAEVLGYRVHGKNIGELHELTAAEIIEQFPDPKVCAIAGRLLDVGLDYLPIGQPLSTFSGGEGQRLAIADELDGEPRRYVFDEPTTGLHRADIARLLALFTRLLDAGSSVIVIEHNLDVIARADWIIDLGPGAGSRGGTVVATGTPRAVADCPDSLTGRYLLSR
ncbi:ATP-binding cassette domain-containing protein [Sciscionella sediminilitoris]|uniref:ATP-binding cassette domain-containing protein n=1 Tax=Sciscionella sediminilitoris TaxID=1445613 RepID=UPI0004DF82DF|nr:excinuclease ABC subunit UvrA [Sciscionella sp. SE31]